MGFVAEGHGLISTPIKEFRLKRNCLEITCQELKVLEPMEIVRYFLYNDRKEIIGGGVLDQGVGIGDSLHMNYFLNFSCGNLLRSARHSQISIERGVLIREPVKLRSIEDVMVEQRTYLSDEDALELIKLGS